MTLDEEILESTRAQGVGTADATLFLDLMRKLAAETPVPEPTAEPAVEPSVEPDVSGGLEGKFAVPVEQVVMQLAQIVAQNFKQHQAYAFFAEMMRGLNRDGAADLFEHQGDDELREAKYFLRRISVLMPGGVPIPVVPTPAPTDSPEEAVKQLIVGEQQAIALFRTLHTMLGDNPMRFTIEQIMSDAQGHLDKLWQLVESSPTPVEKVEGKIARAIRLLKTAAPDKPIPQPGDVVAPPVGTEPPEAWLMRDTMLAHAQAQNENQQLRQQVEQLGQQTVMQQQQADSLSAENQMLQQQQQATSEQATAAMEQATAASQQAANEAEAKMRLSMRVQQMRQTLADLASSDPVEEEGLGFGAGAGPGAPLTPAQQQEQQMAEQAALEEQVVAADAGGSKAQKETAQAQRAQREAQQQTAQAQRATVGGM